MNIANSILLSGVVGVCVSCNRSPGPESVNRETSSEQILAVVGSEHLTLAEYRAELARRSQNLPEAFRTPEQRSRLLDEMIRLKAALAKARASGWDRDPETRTRIEKLIASQFLEAEFAKRTPTNQPVGDGEVIAYYENHPEQFRVPASVRAGVVSFKTSPKAEPEPRSKIVARAGGVRELALSADAPGFARLVQQNSEDQSSRYTGGDTGWLVEGEASPRWPEAVVKAAFALKRPGDVAPLVETTNGIFVVRLAERRAAALQPLAEVREAVRYQLQQAQRQQREQEFSAELKRGLKIEVNHDLLNAIPTTAAQAVDTPPRNPPGS